MYSDIALKIYTAICDDIIKSCAAFWRNFSNVDKLNSLELDCSKYKCQLENSSYNIVCCFDKDFPIVDENVPLSERPFFFAHKGDLNLIKDTSKNVAVIGVLTPTESIIAREKKIVSQLVKNEAHIISGLAKGCDSVAHSECLNNN